MGYVQNPTISKYRFKFLKTSNFLYNDLKNTGQLVWPIRSVYHDFTLKIKVLQIPDK